MKLKTILASVALSLIMAFSATACSGGDTSDDSAESESQADTNDNVDANAADDADNAADTKISDDEYYAQVENITAVSQDFAERISELGTQMNEFLNSEDKSTENIDAKVDEAKDVLNGFNDFLAIDEAPEAYADVHPVVKENLQKFVDGSDAYLDVIADTTKGNLDDPTKLTSALQEFTSAYLELVDSMGEVESIHNAQ